MWHYHGYACGMTTRKSTPAGRTITIRILDPLQGPRCRTAPCDNLATGTDGLCPWCRHDRQVAAFAGIPNAHDEQNAKF